MGKQLKKRKKSSCNCFILFCYSYQQGFVWVRLGMRDWIGGKSSSYIRKIHVSVVLNFQGKAAEKEKRLLHRSIATVLSNNSSCESMRNSVATFASQITKLSRKRYTSASGLLNRICVISEETRSLLQPLRQ